MYSSFHKRIIAIGLSCVWACVPFCAFSQQQKASTPNDVKLRKVLVSITAQCVEQSKGKAIVNITLANKTKEGRYVFIPATLDTVIKLGIGVKYSRLILYKFCGTGCVSVIAIKQESTVGYVVVMAPDAVIKLNKLKLNSRGNSNAKLDAVIVNSFRVQGDYPEEHYGIDFEQDTLVTAQWDEAKPNILDTNGGKEKISLDFDYTREVEVPVDCKTGKKE